MTNGDLEIKILKKPELDIVENLASSSSLVSAVKQTYPTIGGALEKEPKGTLMMLQKNGCIKTWCQNAVDIGYKTEKPDWGSFRQDLLEFLEKKAGNDLKFRGLCRKVELDIAHEWCLRYPSWVSKDAKPPERECQFCIDVRDSDVLSGMQNGTMVYSVTGTVTAKEWNLGNTIGGYRVQYTTKLTSRVLWVDADRCKALENTISAKGVDHTVKTVKDKYNENFALTIDENDPF